MAKKNNSLPLSKKQLTSILGTLYKVPFEALCDIITWDYIHKSPCSLSFYNKKKDWNITEEGTIRISDHWNFIAYKRGRGGVIEGGGNTHAVSDIDVPQGTWAKGEYDHINEKFIITKIFGTADMTSDQYAELKDMIKETIPSPIKKEFPQELIEKRRAFTTQIKEGNVMFKANDGLKLVTRLTRTRLDYINGEEMVVLQQVIKGKKVVKPMPDYIISLNNKEYNKQLLLTEEML